MYYLDSDYCFSAGMAWTVEEILFEMRVRNINCSGDDVFNIIKKHYYDNPNKFTLNFIENKLKKASGE